MRQRALFFYFLLQDTVSLNVIENQLRWSQVLARVCGCCQQNLRSAFGLIYKDISLLSKDLEIVAMTIEKVMPALARKMRAQLKE